MNRAVEFEYNNDEERKILEKQGVIKIVKQYLDEISEIDTIEKRKKEGDIFDKKIAFTIEKEIIYPYSINDLGIIKRMTERLRLMPIKTQEIKVETPQIIYKPKYKFKERIKILFKGEL